MSEIVSASEGAPNIVAVISRAAADPTVDVAKMSALLDMHERLLKREAVAEYNQAFARMAGKLPRVRRDGTVSYETKGVAKPAFKFARWEDIDRAIRPVLEEEGFALSFEAEPRPDGGGLVITGHLMHANGHSRSASIPLPLDASGGKNNLQGYGSTLSYGKRYTGCMLLNIVTEGEDDDGVGAKEYIPADTAATISAELAKRSIPEDTFLRLLGVRSVTEIETKNLAMARNAIRSYRAEAQP